jgi:hypothetical protein
LTKSDVIRIRLYVPQRRRVEPGGSIARSSSGPAPGAVTDRAGRAIVFDRDGLHVLMVENGGRARRKITEIRGLGTEVEVSDGGVRTT